MKKFIKNFLIFVLWFVAVFGILDILFYFTEETGSEDNFNWEVARKKKLKEFQEA